MDGIFNPKIDTIRAFFCQNQGTLFDFQKRAGEVSPPSCAPALVMPNYTKRKQQSQLLFLYIMYPRAKSENDQLIICRETDDH